MNRFSPRLAASFSFAHVSRDGDPVTLSRDIAWADRVLTVGTRHGAPGTLGLN